MFIAFFHFSRTDKGNQAALLLGNGFSFDNFRRAGVLSPIPPSSRVGALLSRPSSRLGPCEKRRLETGATAKPAP
ncbi:hypothetical protein B4113_3651 [Geobacillus sp. B4113_201601]|nr:hypothetical protein B4113_3651 [Geobacillus sp. B4113_201601]